MFDSRPLSSRVTRSVGSSTGGAYALPGEGAGRSVPDLLTRAGSWARTHVRPEVVLLLVVAGFLNLWDLSRNGYANDYYAAAVRSMSTSWHNFLYNSFDPSGVMTVDKPPLAFWIQALSARVFGFNSLAILVPDAVLGMATVVVLYDLVRRRFGRVAGFIAGLTLALTPIQVAMSRHNNPDMVLIFCCVVALWFAQRAFEDGRTKWLVWAGVFVGLGFEAKMSVALIVVPGIVVAWLWTSKSGLWRSVRQLLWGGLALAVVGLAWPVFVWLTPAADRPYISGTADNSIWSLITGYNGLGRISGQSGGPGGVGGGGFGGGGTTFGGNTGVLRLLNDALGGQAGWLLGFAVVSLVGLVALRRLRRRDPGTAWTISIGLAFLLSAIVFSFASGIFHPYYVSFLAPWSAALVGAGAAQLVKPGRHARIFAPLAIAGGVVTEVVVLHTEHTLNWLEPLVIGVGVVAALVLVVVSGARGRWAAVAGGHGRLAAVAMVLAVLSIAPAAWAVDTLGYATSSTFPAGGPADAGAGGGPGGFGAFGGFGGGRGGFGRGGGRGFGGAAGVAPAGGSAPTGGGGAVASLFGGGSSGSASGGFGPGGSGGGGFAGGGGFGAGAGGFGAGGGGFGAGGGGGFGAGGFGGGFGGSDAALTEAVSYANAHGGGTVAVSSQSDADDEIIEHDAKVAGIGGFSGNESEVSAGWLASEVRSGKIRWVLDDESGGGFGGGFSGGRVGARDAMEWVSEACAKATTVDGSVLYDCSGRAAQILAAASGKES